MKKHIFIYLFLIAAAVAMAIFSVFFIRPYVINNTFERHAAKGQYLEKDLKSLESIKDLQYPDGYITNYNLGNYYYHKKKYDKAATYYNTALSWAPLDKEKDCNIRINLVLSNLNQMDFEKIEASDDKTDAINQLHTLRDILTENGCACQEKGQATGHSKDAEKLKKDIDDELDKLEDNPNEDQNQDQNQDNQGQQQDNEDKNDSSDNKLEQKLNQQKSDNNKDRREQQKKLEKQNSDLNPSQQKQNQQQGSQNSNGGSEQNQNNNGSDNQNNGSENQNNGSNGGGSSDDDNSGDGGDEGNQNYKVW